MLRFIPVCFAFMSLFAVAKDRNWKDAVYLGMHYSDTGTAVMPLGTGVVAVPLTGRIYWFQADGLIYALVANYTGRWPNLTANGHTKIAIEGRTAHVLDEDIRIGSLA